MFDDCFVDNLPVYFEDYDYYDEYDDDDYEY
jgi:hypothetical protein